MSLVLDKAQELADAIGDSEELQTLRDATEKLEQDETANSMIKRFQEKQETAQRAAQSGIELPEEQLSELKTIQTQINDMASVKEFSRAQTDFSLMMKQVNDVIAVAVAGPDAQGGPEGSGGGSCGCGC